MMFSKAKWGVVALLILLAGPGLAMGQEKSPEVDSGSTMICCMPEG